MPVIVERPPSNPEILVATIDRPERRNALDHETLDSLRQVLGNALVDECRVLVLTGRGEHFCAGADLSGVEDEDFVKHLRDVLEALHSAPFPVIAAIDGAALGAGTQLAMAADLRIATGRARFGIPAAKLGLTIDHWTAHHLAQQMGGAVARAMLLGAEVYSGEALAASGFIQRLHSGDPAALLQVAVAWAGELATLAPLTIAAHKMMLRSVERSAEPEQDVIEARAAAWNSADLQEGLQAFRERRSPSFRGV